MARSPQNRPLDPAAKRVETILLEELQRIRPTERPATSDLTALRGMFDEVSVAEKRTRRRVGPDLWRHYCNQRASGKRLGGTSRGLREIAIRTVCPQGVSDNDLR